MNIGAAFSFVSALKLAAEWFPASRMGLLTGLTQSLGMLGAFSGEYIVAAGVSSIGWRNTMYGITAMFFVLAVLAVLYVKDRPTQNHHIHVAHIPQDSSLYQEFCNVLTNPQSWINGFYVGFLFAPTAAFAEMWGNYFLHVTYAFDDKTAASLVGLIFLGWGIAGPMVGWFSNKLGRRKPLMYFSALASCVLFCLILYVPMSMPILVLVFLIFGVVNTGVIVSYTVATEINPHKVAGTSLAIANMMSISIGACFQPLIGYLMDYFAGDVSGKGTIMHTPLEVKQAMSILPFCLLCAFIIVFFIKETYCKPLDFSNKKND